MKFLDWILATQSLAPIVSSLTAIRADYNKLNNDLNYTEGFEEFNGEFDEDLAETSYREITN